MRSEPRVAIVIDSLPSLGGGEKVLFTALELYPQADIFTLVYNKPVFVHTPIAQREIKTSWLDRLPLIHKRHRLFLPLMPSAIEQFDLCAYDYVICLSYAVAHGIVKHNGARHVSYTYTPMRYAWTDLNLNGTHTRKNLLLNYAMNAFRRWDRKAAARVHAFAAISHAVSRRIADAYQRTAPVIYPPVEVEKFKPSNERESYYITVSRLVPHKRIDILVQAFSKLNLPLVVVGDGPEMSRLQTMASPNVKLLGYVPDEQVTELLGKARAFVCTAEEDFGIAIVEAQAAGCPVLAFGRGGALETVLERETGLFFAEQAMGSLIEGIQQMERSYSDFPIESLIRNAQKYDKGRFLTEFARFVEGEEPSH